MDGNGNAIVTWNEQEAASGNSTGVWANRWTPAGGWGTPVELVHVSTGSAYGWAVAANGKGVMPGLTLPAFDWGFVKLATATPVDGGLLMVIAFENLSGGMGTAAFVAFLMSLCNQRFTATQFALLSAFASVGRVWVGPLAGVLAESIGWPVFFIVSTLAAVPALWMLWWLRGPVRALESDPAAAKSAPGADD